MRNLQVGGGLRYFGVYHSEPFCACDLAEIDIGTNKGFEWDRWV